MGLPALARMISSPAAALSIGRERWVLASCVLTTMATGWSALVHPGGGSVGDAGPAGVADGPEGEAVGWGHVTGPGPVAGGQGGADVAGGHPAQPHGHHGADDAADHVVAEGRGLDLEPQ